MRFFSATFAFLVSCAAVSAQIMITEIHYHPVEEAAWDASWNPVFDLSGDVHEFVEIQNTGTTTLDLSGWKLKGGVDFTLPAGTTVAAGGFKVIARTPARIEVVYGLAAGSVLGPYTGRLSNNSDTVRIQNAAGEVQDAVTYDSKFPWAQAADALGAKDEFTGLTSMSYNYKGRSLQRVSISAASGDPANWLASPLTGPTPGAAQAVTRTVPKPVIISQGYAQTSDAAAIVRASQAVTVSCQYSSTASLGNVTLEYFLDDVNSTAEARNSVAMTDLGGGKYSASIPGQADRGIVRYRFRANRGDGLETVSPRSDDPQIAPVGTGGALEAWWGYFVTPARTSANPIYDLLIGSAQLTQLNTNIVQNPRRVTSGNATGIPCSKEILVAKGQSVTAATPLWDGTQHAVFAHNGDLYDVQIRYHGSRYHRAATNHSFKLKWPAHQPFNNRDSWFVTGHANEFVEATKMNRLLGLPASTMRTVDWYFNANALETRTEQGEYDNDVLDAWAELQQQLSPGSSKEDRGELYKVVGNLDASQGSLEGPYTKGDNAPMLANAGWTQMERYDWTYSLQSNGWKGPKQIRDMIEGMWAIRGDTPAATTLASNSTNLANTKAWFQANFDIESTLTSLAMLQWMGIWDDTGHNQFFWRRANGKWVRLGWDYDGVMTSTRGSQSIYAAEQGVNVFNGTSWWKDTFFKCFRTEFNQRLWELNNSFFDPTNLSANGFTTAVTFATTNGRQNYINTQLSALGAYTKPARPTNTAPAANAIVLSATNMTTSAFSHPAGGAHASTKWEIRAANGTYEEPVLRVTSTTAKTSYAIPFDALTYGTTYYWRATHIDAAGHPSVVSAETAFTWGTNSSTAGNIVINEVMAFNQSYVQNGADYPDYIELRNNSASAISIAGWTLTDDPLTPAKYTFPAGTSIAAGGYLTLWADKDFTAPGTHTGFGLSSDGDQVILLNGTTIIDSVTFGTQIPDLSIGRIVNGTGSWQLNTPTRGTANTARTLGSTTNLRVNEWMASPAYFEDWFEIFNNDTSPVALGGIYLSDTPASPLLTQVPALSFIMGKGHARFWADDGTGDNHCAFRLGASGDSLVITASNGSTTIDTVTFSTQATDVSQGRLPEGSTTTVSFSGKTASPGYFNWSPASIVINEVMAHAASPYEDAIELHNPTAGAVSIAGWWLSDDLYARQKYQFPAGTSIPAGGYLVVYESQMLAGAVPFSLSAFGDEVILSAPDGSASFARFGPSPQNSSFGRVAASGLNAQANNADYWPQSSSTLGAANAAPKNGPVIINEVMYHPPDNAGSDVFVTEFVELHNTSASAINLNGWRLKGDSEFVFGSTTIPASGYLLVVGFDPVADTAALTTFLSAYPSLGGSSLQIVGPFTPKLANNTQSLEIAQPVTISGSIAYVNQDKVEYRDIAPWVTPPDGGGPSLQRTSALLIGNSAASWASATATPRAVNSAVLLALSVTTSSPLPGGAVGAPYSTSMSAASGTQPYSWSIISGSVPGLVMQGNGTLAGTPATAGAFTFTAQVTDSATPTPATATKVLSITIAATALSITTASPLPQAAVGTFYTQTLAATGGNGSYSWSVAAGALPPGLSLSTAGVLSGTPAALAPGTHNFTVQVADTANYSITKAFSLTVPVPPLLITSATPLLGGMLGDSYSQALTATGGVPGYTWALHSGTLPGGLALSGDGTLSGTCSAIGTFNFTARVTDSDSTIATKALSLTVTPYPLVIGTTALPGGIVGDAYSQTLTATGGVAPRTWSVLSGSLPGWLNLTSAGVLSGTPTAAGTFNFTLQVADAVSTTASQAYSLQVATSGPLDHFTWSYVPASAYAGSPFAARITARDAQERLVTTFSGSAGLSAASGSTLPSPIQITEITDEAEDQIELQNVTGSAINTSGWFMRVSTSLTDITLLHGTSFNLPASLPAGGLIRITENLANQNIPANVYHFGGATNSINWSSSAGPNSKGYALLFDSSNALRDVMIFGWTSAEQQAFSGNVNGTLFTFSGHWSGNGILPGARGPATVDSWQRQGNADTNTAADWLWKHNADNTNATNFNATNPGLILPWTASTPVGISPGSVTFTGGVFTGYLTLAGAGSQVKITADDAAGHTGISASMIVNASSDSNANSLPDPWESANSVTSATADNDGDGMTNAQEYLAGTDPNSAFSKLAITSATLASTLDVSFPAVAGRLYRAATSDDLVSWTTFAPFLATSTGTITVPIALTGSEPRKFARIEIVPW